MKKILAIAGIALLSSCSKDDTLPTPFAIHAHFLTQSVERDAQLIWGDTTMYSVYIDNLNYLDSAKNTGDIVYYQQDENEDPIGQIDFNCTLNGIRQTSDGSFEGTGTWKVASSDGTLSKFNNGYGTLTYKKIDHDKAEREFRVDMVGVGWK